MTDEAYQGPERRKFIRLDYVTPVAYKICKPETIAKILQGYSTNISEAGIFCHIKEAVNVEDILWLSFDRATLSICQDLDRKCFVYQGGIIGKAVRVEKKEDGTSDVGVQFIIREELNLTHIYPKLFFLKDTLTNPVDEGNDEEADEEADKEENGEA